MPAVRRGPRTHLFRLSRFAAQRARIYALRAGLHFAGFDRDAKAIASLAHIPLQMPVLTVSGDITFGIYLAQFIRAWTLDTGQSL